MRKISITLILITICNLNIYSAQTDSLKTENYSVHFQATIINQYKPQFKVKYTGTNSLSAAEESKTSLTSTFFLGTRLWKGASLYLNTEIAGGSGLSSALGIADASNGETFRIGDPAPQIYLARLYFQQLISLSKNKTYCEDDLNLLSGFYPEKYISLTIGEVSIADYFDCNIYSHDPRTQFMCWALMDNGAWDYPANTRGYTPSFVAEYISNVNELRYGFSLLPKIANGLEMNWNFSKTFSQTIEYTHNHLLSGRKGAIRLLFFYNVANMGNYNQSISDDASDPSIELTRKNGRSKYGFAINAEQEISNFAGIFFRASRNDGKNETWAFTEIDKSISAGISYSGKKWKRNNDTAGLAYVNSGISNEHMNYLKAGGKGFMLGDGNLKYADEQLAELYYSAELIKDNLFLTGAYQILLNPGYNSDRKGPVNIFSIRLHAVI